MGKSGIIKDFVLPREIYIGCRQQETVAENNNNRMLHNKKENEMYADLDEILQWAENNYIDVYMPIISRKEYKMMDRALRLIYQVLAEVAICQILKKNMIIRKLW